MFSFQSTMHVIMVALGLLLLGLAQAHAQTPITEPQVMVNRQALSAEQIVQLVQQHELQVAPGRYWYDSRSGLWGYEGGPTQGQLAPGLPIQAVMPEDISVGGTGVFINGRELHPQEVQYLYALLGTVIPGRYWMDAQGIGGFEGQGPMFNLGAVAARQQRRSWVSGHSLRGSVIGDGSVTGYISPDGTGVTCGPDGGCLY